MKNPVFAATLLPALLLTTSCGSSDEIASGTFDDGEGGEASYSISGKDGDSESVFKSQDGEVRINTGSKAKVDLPLGVDLYPNAEVETSVSTNADGKQGMMVVFVSKDGQDEVIAFYRDQMESNGIEVVGEVKTGDMQMLTGQGPDDSGLNISVTDQDEGGVTATLMIGG